MGCSGGVWLPWGVCLSFGVAFGGLFPYVAVLLGVVRWFVCSFLHKLAFGGVGRLLPFLGVSSAVAGGHGGVPLFRFLVSVGQVTFASIPRLGRFLSPFAAGSGSALSQADPAAALRALRLICIRNVATSSAWPRRLLVESSDTHDRPGFLEQLQVLSLLSASSRLVAAVIVLAWCLSVFAANLSSSCFASARFVVTSTARLRRFLTEPPDAHDQLGLRLTVVI